MQKVEIAIELEQLGDWGRHLPSDVCYEGIAGLKRDSLILAMCEEITRQEKFLAELKQKFQELSMW